MDLTTVIGGLTAAVVSGFGLGAGTRLLPVAWNAHRNLRAWSKTPEGLEQRTQQQNLRDQHKKLTPRGRKRESSIIGLYQDLLRHADGSYTRGYDLPLQATMLGPDEVADDLIDGFADMLTVEMPPSTVLQFRYAVAPDPGRAIAEHLRARDYDRTHFPAAHLHDLNIEFFKAMADARSFRQQRASLFVRVPGSHEEDHSSHGLNSFVSSLANDWRVYGFKGLKTNAVTNWSNSRDDGVVRRIRAHEEETVRKAEKIFRLLEMQSPVSLRRLDREQLWRAIYQSHVMGSASVPRLPKYDGLDLRNYLCAETIEDRGWYVMHGIYPATVVSLFAPGEDFIAADATRALTAHPGLSFMHTIITEFITIDREKAKARLDSHIKHVERSGTRADGRYQLTPEAEVSFNDLKQTRRAITGSRETLVKMRQYAVIYGDPARTRGDLLRSLKQLDIYADTLVTAFQALDGVQAGREEPAALHCLYPGSLVGEACNNTNGRELTEVAHSLAAFIPAESSWGGSHRPHTLLTTASGRLIGLNLWDKSSRTNIKSPVVVILGEPGAGKTINGVRIINDALATVPDLRVHALDNGGSLAPHAHVTGGRYHRFNPKEPRAINIWDFPELAYGKDLQLNGITEQISLIVMDAMSLAEATDPLARDLLSKAVVQVLKNIAPRNGPDKRRREATHSDLVAMLEAYDFGGDALNDRAKELALALEKYRGNPWLDAPTHPDFHLDSPYDVYELDSLNAFQPDIKQTLASRIGARVIRAIGEKQPDGTRAPTLLVFDEVHEYRENFPGLLPVLKKGTRHGRKHNVVTMMMTHTYNDFEGMHDITSTAGVKLIGKQTGDLSLLARDAKLSSRALHAIGALQNIDGLYTQWVMVLGSGDKQQVETVQNNLSPSLLWTFTTHPDEANARARVTALRPDWPLAEVITWLAAQYPQGLAGAGLVFDESLLARR
ncbi:hypothetical protein BH18ACI4_BH18ACI4_01000 [soil metagenome]